MSIPLDVVANISRAVAAERGARIEHVTIASADAESARVELLFALKGCPVEPCHILINLSRDEPKALEEQLRMKLTEALDAAKSRS
jgi:hypothetical protein